MRPWFFILVLAGCQMQVPRGIPVPVQMRGRVHVNVNATVTANANTKVYVEPPAPPPPPAPAVALQGAPVVEFFGIPLEGAADVVFVLDVSGSMDDLAQGQIAEIPAAPASPTTPPPSPDAAQPTPPPPDASQPPPPPPSARKKIEVAQSELVDALQHLPSGTQINIVFFNSDVQALAPAISPLDDGNRELAVTYVKETTADGSTALAPALRVAYLMNAHRVVLLSDGLGNVGGNADDVLRDAREAMRGGVRIDTVGIGAGQDSYLLGTLAHESGGLYQAL